MYAGSFCACVLAGGVFSLLDLRVGLPGTPALFSEIPNTSSPFWVLGLLGEVGDCCFGVLFGEPIVGRSFIALEKTSGKSNAPGGILFLLGLP